MSIWHKPEQQLMSDQFRLTTTDHPKADIDCQVLVIGAGPTGLMAGNLLKRSGIDVRVVEERLGPSTESRAGIMSARSIELFASISLADQLFATGVVNSNLDFFVSGEKIGGLRYDQADAPDTPFQFVLMIPQSATERVLLEGLSESGLEVDRGIRVTGSAQDEREVRLTAERGSGEALNLRADYVLGADGAHSAVRHLLGLSFEGAKYGQNFLLGDVEVEWPLDHSSFRVFMHGERIGLFLPLAGTGMSRVMTTDMNPHISDDPSSSAPLELGELQDSFNKASCVQSTLKNPKWLTHFRTHHRCVDRYRVGRVFVAGDAAHIHSPAGGQGMNTGLQDAANLAWKLTAALRGNGGDALLDSYGAERLQVAREVLRFTDKIFTIGAGQVGWRAKLRDALAPIVVGQATGLEFVQRNAFRKFGQIDIVYGPGIAVAETDRHRDEAKSAAPGHRAPNAQLTRRVRPAHWIPLPGARALTRAADPGSGGYTGGAARAAGVGHVRHSHHRPAHGRTTSLRRAGGARGGIRPIWAAERRSSGDRHCPP
ncbi:MAG: hypothetical protein NVSMB18_29960 [Acetobacteraceae bacterium]